MVSFDVDRKFLVRRIRLGRDAKVEEATSRAITQNGGGDHRLSNEVRTASMAVQNVIAFGEELKNEQAATQSEQAACRSGGSGEDFRENTQSSRES